MKRVVLFSSLTKVNTGKITALLFPGEIENKSFAFMPSDGISNCKQEYIDQWQVIAQECDADFTVIDNLAENVDKEILKLKKANIPVISGGNTFKL
jgi:peptidase E